MWDLINYSNLYVVVLDGQLFIKLINYRLAKAIGFNNENEPVGKCWLDFIEEPKRPVIKYIHRKVLEGDSQYNEALTDLVALNEHIQVRWFNTKLNNSDLTFSIGIPLQPITPEDGIDSIRSYFRDVIKKDRTMIKSLQDVVMENSPDSYTCVVEK
jgi:hypothetical protein